MGFFSADEGGLIREIRDKDKLINNKEHCYKGYKGLILTGVEIIISEPSWVYAIEESALHENSASVVYPKGIPVLLIKKEGDIYAISNKCAHMGCPLGGSALSEYTIMCSCHDWKYDIRTGEFLDAKEIKIPVYDFKLTDGKIFIKIEG